MDRASGNVRRILNRFQPAEASDFRAVVTEVALAGTIDRVHRACMETPKRLGDTRADRRFGAGAKGISLPDSKGGTGHGWDEALAQARGGTRRGGRRLGRACGAMLRDRRVRGLGNRSLAALRADPSRLTTRCESAQRFGVEDRAHRVQGQRRGIADAAGCSPRASARGNPGDGAWGKVENRPLSGASRPSLAAPNPS